MMLQVAGLIIAPVAFVFILYALFMYKKRTIQVPPPPPVGRAASGPELPIRLARSQAKGTGRARSGLLSSRTCLCANGARLPSAPCIVVGSICLKP